MARASQRLSSPEDTTSTTVELLQRIHAGDAAAEDLLVEHVYTELKVLARRFRRRNDAQASLQTTDLLNEALLRLLHRPARLAVNDRNHLRALLARALRSVWVDRLRRKKAPKRGGRIKIVALDSDIAAGLEAKQFSPEEMLLLNESLIELERIRPAWVRVADCRLFGLYSMEETAEILGVDLATATKDLEAARRWLFAAIRSR